MNIPHNEFDVIVVGSDPGGASVARDLTKYGKKVLILERGDYQPTRGQLTQMVRRGWIPVTQMPITTRGHLVPRGYAHGDLAILPRPPWFVTNKTAHITGKRVAQFALDPSPRHLPGIFASALRGI